MIDFLYGLSLLKNRYDSTDIKQRLELHSLNTKHVRLYLAQGGACSICFQLMEPISKAPKTQRGDVIPIPLLITLDHVVPLSLGGLDNISNKLLAHEGCNVKKGNTLPSIKQVAMLRKVLNDLGMYHDYNQAIEESSRREFENVRSVGNQSGV